MDENTLKKLRPNIPKKDLPTLSRKDRKKKRNRFVDNCKNFWDKSRVSGYGKGKPLICDICKKRVYKLKTVILEGNSISVCDKCEMPKKMEDLLKRKGTSNVVIH